MKPKTEGNKILSSNLFPVVGIGASVGGLNAFKKFLKAIPENSGMAYVLVQHLDPKHESILPELLQKVTMIPVLEISHDMKVQPDHIYIIPSNKILLANDGILQLGPRLSKQNNPIDLFFTSLAEVHRSHAIGIVLTGNGSDGTEGLKAIKEHQGTTFTQDEASSVSDSMPKSAVAAGVVDFILSPEQMPGKLLEIKQDISRKEEDQQNIPKQEEDVFKQMLHLLLLRKGTDFTFYKQTTIRRRIDRRIALLKMKSPALYLAYLWEHKAEQDALYQDLLIPVTGFFRDQKVFENLCKTVFPQMIKNISATAAQEEQAIRIWVAACSTGEEAYSIAICLNEIVGDKKVQVFATDISEPAIEKARLGIYSANEVQGLSPHRLKTFFTKSGESYKVNKQVRDMCVFAVHNFLKDPPFIKIDFVTCRNVLIYLQPYLQKKALTSFHYALNPKGMLLLGKSETGTTVPDLFASAGGSDKLFNRKDVPGNFLHKDILPDEKSLKEKITNLRNEKMNTDFKKTTDDIILSKYTPAGVVVNEAMDIVQFRGSTVNYLEQAAGKPSHNLIKMAKNGLAFELRNILLKVKKENTTLTKDNLHIREGNIQRSIGIEVIPLPNIVEPHYLVLFHETAGTKNAVTKISASAKKDKKELRITELEKELSQAREDMRSIAEDQEAANEELQSANEELLSGSEELQSLNEELETSKEELLSTNEELTNLNEQVTSAKYFAESIVATIREPLLVLDKQLRIKTANEAFYTAYNVTKSNTEGVLIYDLDNKQWNIPALRTLLEELLPQNKNIIDFELSHHFPVKGEQVMLLNAREMPSKKDGEKLILLAIKDITERMHRQLELEDKVLQRTHELSVTNALLQQKNEALIKSNHELESFTYISSHDLQEPLRKLQTFTSLILDRELEGLSPKVKDYFTRINKSAGQMQTLLLDLLAYSHANVNDKRKYDSVNLKAIVEEVKEELAELMQEKGAAIKCGKLCDLRVNMTRFKQVLSNLTVNAIKFSKPGIATLINITSTRATGNKLLSKNPALTAGNLLPETTYCHINFKDNGIGFDPVYANRIFEVFQRLHDKEEFEGTGIGLAIVKRIVENHNGCITATGATGQGAAFDIYIPE